MVRLDQYDTLARLLRPLLVRRVHFRDGLDWQEHFASEPRTLLVANHGPLLGPLAWVPAIVPRMVDLGFGHLRYSAIAHPIVRNVPLFARMVGFEHWGRGRLGVEDYVELFRAGRLDVLSVAPEGEFSLYGNGVDIQRFRSYRSLEIALRADCAIVLVVAVGLEHWHVPVPLGGRLGRKAFKRVAELVPFVDRLHEDALDQATHLSVSFIYRRIPDLYVATERYHPALGAAELASEGAVRDEQLRVEGERMRRQMMRMVDALKAEWRAAH